MRVLIIDDDMVDRKDIVRVLQTQAGTSIVETATAQEGMAALTNIKFDIVLLDYLLPDKNGLEVLAGIKTLNLSHPCGIILMSGNDDSELLEKALEAGAQDFLGKNEINQQRLQRTIHLARKRFELEYHVRKSQERSKIAARMDNLTRLFNRTAFETALEKMLSSNTEYEEGAVIFLDVDNFKFFNECYGHEVGDELLKQVAARIKQVVDKNDQVARVGSNEFAVLFKAQDIETKKRRLLNRLLKALDFPFAFDDVEINCTFSIGCTFLGNEKSKKDIIKQANLALHKAKGESGYSVTEFDASLSAEIEKQRKMKEGLEFHLNRGEFNVVYQPIIAESGETVSLEALVRWPENSPFGHFRPDEFIPISEQNQTIDKLGEFVFKQAVETLASLKSRGYNDIRVSVNFSPIQLNQWELSVRLVDLCRKAGVSPSDLVLEITETALLSNDFATKRMISELATAGFTISLDDFGTGYSSISHLINFPINQVKMDRSVVPVSQDDSKRKNLLSSLVSMCKSIGAVVVIEGIEEQWQADFCRALRAEKQQGYFYSKPISFAELTEKYLQSEEETAAPRCASM